MSVEAIQPKVIVIAGANGAGKSTLAPLLLRDAFGLMEDVVKRRYQAGLRNFFRAYQPLATTWTMYDTSLLNAPQLVATGSSNTALALSKGM